MDALFAAMMQDTALQKLQEYFNGKADENLAYGLSGSQKHVAFAAAFSRAPQPFVILVHNSEAVSEWREDLAALLPETEIVLYRAPGIASPAATRLADHIVQSLEAAASGS